MTAKDAHNHNQPVRVAFSLLASCLHVPERAHPGEIKICPQSGWGCTGGGATESPSREIITRSSCIYKKNNFDFITYLFTVLVLYRWLNRTFSDGHLRVGVSWIHHSTLHVHYRGRTGGRARHLAVFVLANHFAAAFRRLDRISSNSHLRVGVPWIRLVLAHDTAAALQAAAALESPLTAAPLPKLWLNTAK